MTMRKQIEAQLIAAFNPSYIEVVDESHRHNVPAGAESHFKVLLVSENFIGTRLISRHRQIYSVLSEALAGSVHALALHTYTAQEWNDLQDKQRLSPPCMGAGTQA
ncbi:transcriptional regulator BolA [Citrobacter sp. JGM124]|uniref:transcriptional regulator BolA n=1 Tax=Citrobacter sp. JGM124 TaxID=2799789 RepID=UPI001BA54E1B|nr:transcriptional regulator BolA [Citrobacter sp. JGM124]MBS0848719.1 transcriptional regulator BolA [Citrobacter sp. JGM124]